MNQNKIESLKERCLSSSRISSQDALELFELPLADLSQIATAKKQAASGDKVFYIRNFHVEPTNICRFHCKFCSYRKGAGDPMSWDTSLEEIRKTAASYSSSDIQEVHIVGGVHPSHTLEHYAQIISTIKRELPSATIKAFSAIEHIHMANISSMSYAQELAYLKEHGMGSITGGGAEIFAPRVREQICADKATGEQYLQLHRAAHELDIKTNATMLYGHIETHQERIDHMSQLRQLQDQTGGFNAFIPLKFRSKNNPMSHLGEVSIVDDMRTLAIARIFLDNIPHIKAYHPMYGAATTEMALMFGADDIDGSLEDTTKIYTMAGVKSDAMTQEKLIALIQKAGYTPTLRDTFYNSL